MNNYTSKFGLGDLVRIRKDQADKIKDNLWRVERVHITQVIGDTTVEYTLTAGMLLVMKREAELEMGVPYAPRIPTAEQLANAVLKADEHEARWLAYAFKWVTDNVKPAPSAK